MAALCQAAGSTKTATTVQSLLSVLQSPSGQPSAKHLALLSIGEVGRTTDLSAFTNLQQTLTSSLASSSDDLKTAAALSLGAVAVGNLQTYLPFILQQIQEQVSFLSDICLRPDKTCLAEFAASLALYQRLLSFKMLESGQEVMKAFQKLRAFLIIKYYARENWWFVYVKFDRRPFLILFCSLKASNPKDQYLLLRALNEVITSVNAQQLPPNYQSEVRIEDISPSCNQN